MELYILDILTRIGIGFLWIIFIFRAFPEFIKWIIETYRELFIDEHVNTMSISKNERRKAS